jgi:septum formation protein
LDERKLILASASPRRAELLRQAGFRFLIRAFDVDETGVSSDPVEHVRMLSQRKARTAAAHLESGLIIGADTIVYHGNRILGKPEDAGEARSMLSELSGQTHQVYTGITLLEAGGRELTAFECTDVTFRLLSAREIDRYVRSGGPMDKAGAYGIQEQAGLFVSKIRGCYFNVVGFPIARFYEMLKTMADESEIMAHLLV